MESKAEELVGLIVKAIDGKGMADIVDALAGVTTWLCCAHGLDPAEFKRKLDDNILAKARATAAAEEKTASRLVRPH